MRASNGQIRSFLALFVGLTMDDHIIETWHINNRINLYVLDALSPE